MKHRKVTIKVMIAAAVLISVMMSVSGCGRGMGDAADPAGNSGVPTGDAADPAGNKGVPTGDAAVPAGNSGVPTENATVPAENAAASPGNQGAPQAQAQSGQPALNRQAVPLLKGESTSEQPESAGLLDKASPETSAMTLFTYDGTTVRLCYMFDSEKEREILDALSSVKAEPVENWSAEDASLPVYGIEIGREDGLSLFAAWTNGRWIAQDGNVYKFDFDFEGLKQRKEWESAGELPSFTSFPCARIFTQEKGKWNTRFLVPAAPLSPPRGITMTLDSWDKDVAAVTISNESGGEWSCGEFYELQVLIDGTWYEIPAMPGNWGFNCMGFYIPDGGSQSMLNHLAMYGELPSGKYRLVMKELSVEHDIQ